MHTRAWHLATGSFLARNHRPAARHQPPASSLENAYRQNNIGVALLDQFKYKEAAEAFARALQIDPKLPLAHINFAIALYNIPDCLVLSVKQKTPSRSRLMCPSHITFSV